MKTLKVIDELDNSVVTAGYCLLHNLLHLDYETSKPIGHGGDTNYHHAKFDFLPEEKIGVVVFSNFETAPKITRDIEIALFNEYLKEMGFPKKEAPKRKTVDFDPNKYAGKYVMKCIDHDLNKYDRENLCNWKLEGSVSKLEICKMTP